MIKIDELLQIAVDLQASDMHLAVSVPPMLRIHGQLMPVPETDSLTHQDIQEILQTIMKEEQREAFEQEKELDFSYECTGATRFRVNACHQRGTISFSFRLVPIEIPSAEELGLPPTCLSLVTQSRGLVLVTGPTGSGKSTTLAAMIEHLNQTTNCRIITLEDPIEFVYKNKKSMIIQREVGEDTHSFSRALRRVLRQDPQVILVGELRDLESISLALTASETGHLVLGTLHTNGAVESIERMVNAFPAEQQQFVLAQLSTVLQGVIYQLLLPRADGKGRVAAFEILLGTPAMRNLIRQNQLHQMRSYMVMGAQYGMQTIERSLAKLVQEGLVSKEEALPRAIDSTAFDKFLRSQQIGEALALTANGGRGRR